MLSALRAHLRGIHKEGRSQDAATRKPRLLQPQSHMSHVAHTHERTHTHTHRGPRVAKSRTPWETHVTGIYKVGEGCGLGYLPALLLTFAAKVDIINLQRVADNGMWCVCVGACGTHTCRQCGKVRGNERQLVIIIKWFYCAGNFIIRDFNVISPHWIQLNFSQELAIDFWLIGTKRREKLWLINFQKINFVYSSAILQGATSVGQCMLGRVWGNERRPVVTFG